MMKKEEKFKNEQFNELYRFMEKMDSSDDDMMIQVSTLNQNKANMEMDILCTGRSGGKPVLHRVEVEAALILAMEKNDDLKRLLIDVVMHYEPFQAFKRRRQS